MKALTLNELRDLLQSAAFAGWWSELVRAETGLHEARARHEDLLAQARMMELRADLAGKGADEAFTRAGEIESRAAHVNAEAQELENRALELVAAYEEQRFKVSDLWYRLGGAERTLEERGEALAAVRAALEAAQAAPARSEARARLGQAETRVRQAERQVGDLDADYRREAERKAKLWQEVEAAWSRSFELGLQSTERATGARRFHREAERLYQESDARRTRARQLAADAEAALRERDAAGARREELLAQARQRFGCVPGRTFLYWRRPGDGRTAWAVALQDDADGYNIEVRARAAYVVGRQRGVAFLEPARDGEVATAEEGDRRFERWFLGARQGRTGPGGTAG